MMLIAHRGASGTAPENTLAAFRQAIKVGALWLEMDVCSSRDGEIVVIHDDTLERTTNGRGRVRDCSLAELKRLDAGSWFHKRFKAERIPTLREALLLARRSGVGLLIEMKPGTYLDGRFERDLVRLLERERMIGKAFVMSFNHSAVGRVKRIEPRIKTLLLVARRTALSRLLRQIRTHRADGLSVAARLADKTLANSLHVHGKLLITWTVNSLREAKRLTAAGVDGLTTDWPERLGGRG
jgi:glycerophosphoryl diester phosphodiesterase